MTDVLDEIKTMHGQILTDTHYIGGCLSDNLSQDVPDTIALLESLDRLQRLAESMNTATRKAMRIYCGPTFTQAIKETLHQ